MTCAPSEDRSAWASTQSDQSSLCAQWVAKDPSGQRRLWSDWADAQTDQSLCWAHMPLCWFCHEVAHVCFQLWFAMTNGFSGQILFEKWTIGSYNVVRWGDPGPRCGCSCLCRPHIVSLMLYCNIIPRNSETYVLKPHRMFADLTYVRLSLKCWSYEPPHDKTSKMTVRPAKTQISLGISPDWSESLLSVWKNIRTLATH